MTGWDEAGQVAGVSDREWETLLVSNPKVLWGLVADVVKAVKAHQGERRTGRRPAAGVSSIDELYGLLFPKVYVTEPFPQAFAAALGRRSQRDLAEAIGYNQATVSRLLSGKTPPTCECMERIAAALKIPPTYFLEYRAMKVGQVITSVLLDNPAVSIEAVRKLAKASA
jgi:DNA-binding Xre family transcriptional regulator